jgi:peptidyl-prolyl cis-trans isomerase C
MRRLTALFLVLAAMLSCTGNRDSNIMYVFKGEVVSVSDFKGKYTLWLRKNGLDDSKEMRKNYLMRELSDRLLYEAGMKEGIDNLPEVANKINDFKRKTIIDYMRRKTKKELFSIDDETVRKYYLAHKNLFYRQKLHRLYALRTYSKKSATSALEQLRNGASIRMLSARFSDDENLSRNNGDWGLFSEDVMDELWKKDVLSSLPGEILGPYLDSDNFYTIIEIAGYAYKRHLSFLRAYPLIIEKLVNSQGGEKWNIYQNTMISEYGAKINLNNLDWE